MVIKIENGVMSSNLGRITVAYFEEEGIVKIVHSYTGETLRTDQTGTLNIAAFKAVVMKYQRIMGVK